MSSTAAGFFLLDSDSNFDGRNTRRVDIAQIKAEEYIRGRGVYYKKMGFDSKADPIPVEHWMKLPVFLRKMPDMFIVSGDHFHFVEVKGCRDTLKIKLEDYAQYVLWNEKGKLLFLVYSTTKSMLFVFSLDDLRDLFKDAELKVYEDNRKEYYDIPVFLLEQYRRSVTAEDEEE